MPLSELDLSHKPDVMKLCALFKLTLEDLQIQGQNLCEQGASRTYAVQRRCWQLDEFKSFWHFLRVWPDAEELNPMLSPGESGSLKRRTLEMRPDSSTGLATCLLMLWIFLDIGRCKGDLVPITFWCTLSLPALVLTRIVAEPWGNLTEDQRVRMRDLFVNVLSRTKKTRAVFDIESAPEDVIRTCARGMPRFSWTTVSAQICCSRAKFSTSHTVGTRCMVEVSIADKTTNLATLINQTNCQVTESHAVGPCPDCQSTRNWRLYRRAVYDRPPKILIVYLKTSIGQESAQSLSAFAQFEFEYFSITHQRVDRRLYLPFAGLFKDDTHYVVRTAAPTGPFHHWLNGDLASSTGWWKIEDDKENLRVHAIFFRYVFPL